MIITTPLLIWYTESKWTAIYSFYSAMIYISWARKRLITVMILFQPKVRETTHLSNSQNVGCGSDYVCDEFGDDETDEDGADAGDILSDTDSDIYKTEEEECDEETMSESDDDHQECPRNELQYAYLLSFL